MIRHSFKMIWAERKSNLWILIELIFVFSILWFCSSFIYEKGKQLSEPMGVDIKHTYLLRFKFQKDINKDNYSNDYDFPQDGITILDRLKKYPGIESCCFADESSLPYSGSYSAYSIEKDSISYQIAVRGVSHEYFDVFKIKFQRGKPFDSNELISKNQVVASPDKENKFFKEDIVYLKQIMKKERDQTRIPEVEPKTREEWEAYVIEVPYQVVGVVNKIKRSEYELYERIEFQPLKRKNFDPRTINICIRVKPETDKYFTDKFQKEMGEQLKVGPFELASITPFSEKRTKYLVDDQEIIQLVMVVISFLLINVFLGILGTFRFRANARRGEIGLRTALGSSKKKIQQLLLTETFLMLFIASIPGTIIALNIQMSGLLPKLGIPFIKGAKGATEMGSMCMVGVYLITYLITFAMMLIIMWLGTWYPAKKSSEIQPAEALHYE